MNQWLWAAAVLTVGLAALLVVALRGRIEGVIALEAAGADAALIMLLLAEGTERQAFVDLALVVAVMSFTGSIVYLRFMDDA